jgi:hypothetical protein
MTSRAPKKTRDWRRIARGALLTFAALVALFVTAVLVMASAWPTLQRVEAGKSLAYPDLKPRTYQLGYDRVYDESLAAAKDQGGWVVTQESRATGQITAEAQMPVTGWRHKVEVSVQKRSPFVSRVYAASEGHDAPGDLGQNARNLRAYFEALDKRLGAARVGE